MLSGALLGLVQLRLTPIESLYSAAGGLARCVQFVAAPVAPLGRAPGATRLLAPTAGSIGGYRHGSPNLPHCSGDAVVPPGPAAPTAASTLVNGRFSWVAKPLADLQVQPTDSGRRRGRRELPTARHGGRKVAACRSTMSPCTRSRGDDQTATAKPSKKKGAEAPGA